MPPRFFGDDDSGWTAPAAPSSCRVALVVGNGAYRANRLENPARDARLVAKALDALDFDTELLIDAGKTILETAIVRLGERLEKAGPDAVGFFYFAGHGIQYQGANYLVPVDAHIPDTRYLKSGAIVVDYLVEELGRTHSLANVIVLDACRDSAVRDAGGGLTQGLASIQNLPDGTLVVFSTAAGQVADDGSGDNSPYASALVRHLNEPNRRLEEIFFAVSRDVAQATGNSQRPALFVQGAIAPLVLKPATDTPVSPEPDVATGNAVAPLPIVPPPAAATPAVATPAVAAPIAPAPAAPSSIASPLALATAQAPAVVRRVDTAAAPATSAADTGAEARGETALDGLAATAAQIASPPAVEPTAVETRAEAAATPSRWVKPQALAGAIAAELATAGKAATRRPQTLLAAAAGVVALAVLAGAYAFWPSSRSAVDLADPASWPVEADSAIVWRAETGKACHDGWTRVLDGLYCLKAGRPIGAIWDAGRLVMPQASVMTLALTPKTGPRCPDGSLFEAESTCLDPESPPWLGAPPENAGLTVVGAAAGMAGLSPRSSADCGAANAQFPISSHCLTGAASLGPVTPTPLGEERLADRRGGPISLTAYHRLSACPRETTVLENDKYCLAMTLW